MLRQFHTCSLNTLENENYYSITVPKRVQGTHIKYARMFRVYICYVQACSVNTLK
jgi:hypothetical protein